MRILFYFLLQLFIIQACNAQHTNKSDWSSDLDYISKELPQRHINLFSTQSKDYYLQQIQKIKTSVPDLSNFEITLRLQQTIAAMGDSHTRVNLGKIIDRNKILPLKLYWFRDGIYILKTTQENEEILGNRIISINQTPIKTVIDSLSTLVTIDNRAIVKSYIPELLPLVQILQYFKFTHSSKIELGLEDMYGTNKDYIIEPSPINRKNIKIVKPASLALCYQNQKSFFTDYYQPNDKVYYIQYNKCYSKELDVKYNNGKNADQLPSFKEFENKVFENLKSQQIDKIVFDLRFNRGGNSYQGTVFIEKFSKYLDKHPEKKIFVITGRSTFSSAILNVMDFKKLTNASIVGEETSGKPNHFGEVRSFKLPYSGLNVSYSTKYFTRSANNEKTIKPDISIESDFKDYRNGIDPVYEWIRAQ